MMKYLVSDRWYTATDAADLVSQMHELSFAPAEDDAAYIEETAARISEQFGKAVRSDSAENFVADLIQIGFIKPEVEGEKK